MDKPLDGFEVWMVKQNLGYVKTEGLDAVLNRLRVQGYQRVANAVEAKAKPNTPPADTAGLNATPPNS